jgi:FkbM family methyltransferase
MFDPYQRVKLMLRGHRVRRRGDPEIARLPALLAGARRSIDVGANRGAYTFWLSRLSAAVEAFEPNPVLAGRLTAAGLSNVMVHCAALSDVAEDGTLHVPGHRRGGLDDPGGSFDPARAGAGGMAFPASMVRLDDLGFDNVDFIKIDVEGHEERVLNGGWRTIEENRPSMLVELEERMCSGCLVRVAGRLSRLGHQARFFDEGAWRELDELGAGQIGPSGRYINNFLLACNARLFHDTV